MHTSPSARRGRGLIPITTGGGAIVTNGNELIDLDDALSSAAEKTRER